MCEIALNYIRSLNFFGKLKLLVSEKFNAKVHVRNSKITAPKLEPKIILFFAYLQKKIFMISVRNCA